MQNLTNKIFVTTFTEIAQSVLPLLYVKIRALLIAPQINLQRKRPYLQLPDGDSTRIKESFGECFAYL
jgi:hypothetical protein